MSTVTVSDTSFVGSDRLLVGIVLSVLTFWLFAQSVINVVPAMKSSLDISLETLTLAVSLSALFSGCFSFRQRLALLGGHYLRQRGLVFEDQAVPVLQ